MIDWTAAAAVAADLTETGERVAAVRGDLVEAEQARRDAVLAALAIGMGATQIARLSGLTRSAIYQIRDRGR